MEHVIACTRRQTAHPAVAHTDDIANWMTTQAQPHGLRWLLAHTSEGVIWGEINNGALHLSWNNADHHDPAVALRWNTVWQCRIFGETGEVLLWQAPHTVEGWQARLFRDAEAHQGDLVEYIDEEYSLWGTAREEDKHNGFIRLVEGTQGIVHTPPLENPPTERNRARLRVRHYLAQDPETGIVYVASSRLVRLCEPEG